MGWFGAGSMNKKKKETGFEEWSFFRHVALLYFWCSVLSVEPVLRNG